MEAVSVAGCTGSLPSAWMAVAASSPAAQAAGTSARPRCDWEGVVAAWSGAAGEASRDGALPEAAGEEDVAAEVRGSAVEVTGDADGAGVAAEVVGEAVAAAVGALGGAVMGDAGSEAGDGAAWAAPAPAAGWAAAAGVP